MSKPPTVRAVLAYAAQLRREGRLEQAADPFASPYMPTEAGARQLSTRLGPAAAIDHMRKRAAMHKHDEREHNQLAAKSLDVHKARQRQHRDHRDKHRAHLSEGTRIDGGIARLAIVASSSGSQIGQSVHGGTPSHVPPFTIDAADKARRIAVNARRAIEDLEDEAKIRDLSAA